MLSGLVLKRVKMSAPYFAEVQTKESARKLYITIGFRVKRSKQRGEIRPIIISSFQRDMTSEFLGL